MKSLFTIIDNFYFKRNGTHLSENVRKKMVIHSKIKEKELVEDEEERQQEENGTVAAARPATSDKTQLTSSRLEDDEQEEKVESNKKDNKGSDEDFYLSTPSVKLPLKLLFVLDCGKYEHILDWTSNGKVILVKDTEIFSNVVLPALFEKDAKFESFTRKMRRWGFSTKKGQIVPSSDSSKKPNKNRTKYLFQHNEFQRNQPELCANISCSNASRADALSFDELSNRTNSFQQQNLQVGIAPANFVQLNNAASFASNSSLAQQNLSTPATSAFMMPFQQQGNIADILNSSQNASSMFLSNTFPALPQLQEQQTAALSGDRAQSLLLLLLQQQQQQQNQHNAMTLQNLGILQQQQGILDYSRLLLPQANQDLTTMGRANLNLLKDEGHNGSQLSGRLPNDSNMTAINLLQSFPNIGVNNYTSADLPCILPVSSNPNAQEPSNFLQAASGLGSDNALLSRPGGSAISPFGMLTHHANLLDSGFSQIQPPTGQTQVQQNHYFVSRLPQQYQQEQLRKRTRNEVDDPVEEQERKNTKTSCDKGESSTSNISSV